MDQNTLTIIGIVVSIGLGLPAVWTLVKNHYDSRVCIHRIRSRKTKFAKGILELFREKFPDEFEEGGGVSDDFVREVLDQFLPGKRTADTENVFLIAVLEREVVGFIFAPYYPHRASAMVSYFGVKSGLSLDFQTAEELVKKLKRVLRSLGCKTLYFETQKRGLVKIFSKLAAQDGDSVSMRMFDFEYMAAPVSADGNAQPANLFAVGIDAEIPDIISKPKLLEILKFLYYEVYGDVHPIDDRDNFLRHQQKLKDLITHFENSLPDTILTYPADESRLVTKSAKPARKSGVRKSKKVEV